MKNVRIIISYDGTNFLGWQKTNSGRSIEQELQSALEKVLRHPVNLQAASRTDAGVHALGQVVNFFIENDDVNLDKLQHSLNCMLDDQIQVLSIEEVDIDFHPTIDNEGKLYGYYICNSSLQVPFNRKYSWHVPLKLNTELMQEAGKMIEGLRDFSCFCNERSNFTRSTICRIESVNIIQLDESDRICVEIKGSRFLYKMVRNIVGTLVYIGNGKIPLSALEKILSSKSRSSAGITAPAHGLFLKRVYYSDKKMLETANCC